MTIRAMADMPWPAADLEPSIDHLVYAAPDLEGAVARFEALTGIRPAEGGRHVGRGTRNYLVGLGERSYLEIIGPDVEHPVASGVGMPFGIDRLGAPSLVSWAVRPPDIAEAARVSAEQGADLRGPMWMRRRTSDGRELKWRIASSVPMPFGGITPFLIDWGDTVHPAADPEPPRARLLSLSAAHPDPVAVQKLLGALGLTLPVTAGPVMLTAVLDTPRGPVVVHRDPTASSGAQ